VKDQNQNKGKFWWNILSKKTETITFQR